MLRLTPRERRRANVGSTAMIAKSSEMRHAAASVSRAGRSCGSLALLRAIVSTMDEIVMRMLAFVSAMKLSWT